MENKEQFKAIHHGAGPLMIIAGPGSGKTYTITERLVYLINEMGAEPSSFLVLTFSRAAAEEMESRFRKRILSESTTGFDCNQVTFGTFHSVFLHILKKVYGSSVQEYLFDESEDYIDPSSYHDDAKEKSELNLSGIKFDEMLVLTAELLRERKDIRDSIKEKYKWILIDEFQDIDELQFEIIRMITDKDSNITIVGDDDQSIYGFRGARPDIMLGFKKYYPSSVKVVLKMNYRSSREIVKATGKLIRHNKKRFRKHVQSFKGDGGEVIMLDFSDVREEYEYIVNQCKEQKGDTAVLCRTNRQIDQLAVIFAEKHENVHDYHVMTFHESKGLEFDTVYIPDIVEGYIPHINAISKDEREEERRMFYVAMTRAKSRLVLCRPEVIRQRRRVKSRFLKEIEWFI